MPITLRASADALNGMQGFSFGLLTFALFLGFLPTWLGVSVPSAGWFLALGAALSLGLLLPGLRKRP
jgi:FSR family fosmidomycin resistance protein-like MFS transporter